jgi:hypothetical protein
VTMSRFEKIAATAIVLACACSAPALAMPLSGMSNADNNVLLVAKKKKPTQRQEVDQSVQSGTVPARYRKQVPKQYQQYIPWATK